MGDMTRAEFARLRIKTLGLRGVSSEPPHLVPPRRGQWVRRSWGAGPVHLATGDLAWRGAWVHVHVHVACGKTVTDVHGVESTTRIPRDACRVCARSRFARLIHGHS
jgi:hypothetical protein